MKWHIQAISLLLSSRVIVCSLLPSSLLLHHYNGTAFTITTANAVLALPFFFSTSASASTSSMLSLSFERRSTERATTTTTNTFFKNPSTRCWLLLLLFFRQTATTSRLQRQRRCVFVPDWSFDLMQFTFFCHWVQFTFIISRQLIARATAVCIDFVNVCYLINWSAAIDLCFFASATDRSFDHKSISSVSNWV